LTGLANFGLVGYTESPAYDLDNARRLRSESEHFQPN